MILKQTTDDDEEIRQITEQTPPHIVNDDGSRL